MRSSVIQTFFSPTVIQGAGKLLNGFLRKNLKRTGWEKKLKKNCGMKDLHRKKGTEGVDEYATKL